MLERLGSWLVRAIPAAMVWFDRRPGWIQLLIVLAIIAAFVEERTREHREALKARKP